MKKSTWKKLTGKSLALLMALVMAGSNVSYAAALTETAFAAENAVDQEDASFEDSAAEDEQSAVIADESVVSEDREETDPEESAESDAAETAEAVPTFQGLYPYLQFICRIHAQQNAGKGLLPVHERADRTLLEPV